MTTLILVHGVASTFMFALLAPVLDSLFVFIAPSKRKALLTAALEDARAGASTTFDGDLAIFDEWTQESRDLWRCRRDIVGSIDHRRAMNDEQHAAFVKRCERYLRERIAYLEKLERHERAWTTSCVGALIDRVPIVAGLVVVGLNLALGWYETAILFLFALSVGKYYYLLIDIILIALFPSVRKELLLKELRAIEQGQQWVMYNANPWSQEGFQSARLNKALRSSSESFAGPWRDYLRRRIAYLEELEGEPRTASRLLKVFASGSIVRQHLLDSVQNPRSSVQEEGAKVPAVASKLLLLVASRADILVELEQEFCTIQGGRRVARRWYWSQVLRSVLPQLCSKLRNAFVSAIRKSE